MAETAKKRVVRVAYLIGGQWSQEQDETIPGGITRREYLAGIYEKQKRKCGTVRIRSAA